MPSRSKLRQTAQLHQGSWLLFFRNSDRGQRHWMAAAALDFSPLRARPGGRRAEFQIDGESLQRPIVGIQKARAEVGGAAAVDDGRAYDVRSRLECQTLRDPVVDHRLAVAVNADYLLPVHPPDGGGVRSNRQTHAGNLARRFDDGDQPKQHVRRWLPE